jgi:hypothetical protein
MTASVFVAFVIGIIVGALLCGLWRHGGDDGD